MMNCPNKHIFLTGYGKALEPTELCTIPHDGLYALYLGAVISQPGNGVETLFKVGYQDINGNEGELPLPLPMNEIGSDATSRTVMLKGGSVVTYSVEHAEVVTTPEYSIAVRVAAVVPG